MDNDIPTTAIITFLGTNNTIDRADRPTLLAINQNVYYIFCQKM